jgi:choline dehydrogenase-like flavoprotein
LPDKLSCDVAIVGTGAGAGITAELLTAAGLSVVLIEEGPLKSSTDFRQREADAYPTLYQESANRKTADKGVSSCRAAVWAARPRSTGPVPSARPSPRWPTGASTSA